MDYRQTAEAILAGVGGAANIAHLEHCSTRLRFTLRDSGAARVEELQKIPGVLGVVMTAQCQVIIGNQVVEVYEALTPLLSGNNATSVAPDAPVQKRKAGDVVLDFIVGVDLFMTPTIMALADYVLPAATYPERDGLRIGDGPQRGETINKVCSVGECKSDMEINLELGRRLNPDAWPWADVKEMFSSIIAETGYSFDEMREIAPAYPQYTYKKY